MSFRDAWAAALGGRDKLAANPTRRMRWRVQMLGLQGTSEEWVTASGKRRYVLDLGGFFHIERTFDGQHAYALDQNGRISRLTGPELADAVTDAYEASWSHLVPGRMPGRVEESEGALAITPSGGQRVVWSFDPRTGLPTSSQRPAQERIATTEYSDYAEYGGILFPRVQRTVTEDARFDTTELLEEVELGVAVDDALFARPSPRADDVRLDGDELRDIELEPNTGHLFLRAWLGGAPVWMLLDTGAGATVLHEATARELGLGMAGRVEGRGAGSGSVESSLVSNVTIEVGQGTARAAVCDQTVVAVDLTAIEALCGRRLDGILGYDFISRFVLTLDYPRRRMHLARRGGAVPALEPVPLRLQNQVPHAPAAVTVGGRRLQGEWLVDTGFAGALSVSRPFHEAHGLVPLLPRSVVFEGSVGIGGASRDVLGRVEQIEVGGLSFPGPVATFSLDEGGAGNDPTRAGILGGVLLARCVVTFDYDREHMYLQPSTDLSAPFRADGLGVSWITGGRDRWHELTVRRVTEGSPAAAAGLQPGDRLLSVDGRSADTLTLHEMWLLSREEGRVLHLVVDRQGERLEWDLKLKPVV